MVSDGNLERIASGTGDEIAQAVLLLVRTAYVTGQTIAINAGSFFS